MSTKVAVTNENEMTIWEDKKQLAEIRNIFAQGASDAEFAILVGLGKATGLNPFLKEIWLVKYGNKPAQIYIGRDGYRKTAQKNPNYDYHQPDAVYENDTFKIVKGEVEHSYCLKDRGRLVGAYCVVKSHKSTRPIYVYVELGEYNTKQSVWAGKPATMVKKVAEAQALRLAFQEVFAGTYDESEQFEQESQTAKLNRKLAEQGKDNAPKTVDTIKDSSNTYEAEVNQVTGEVAPARQQKASTVVETEAAELVTEAQIKQIDSLLIEKKFNNGRFDKALAYFKVENLTDLTQEDADKFIILLEKV